MPAASWRQHLRERQSSIRELLASTRVTSTPIRWAMRPTIAPGDEICLFLTYAVGGHIPAHSLAHARAWRAAGFKVVLVVTIDAIESFVAPDGFDAFEGAVIRRNEGYDFGGWAAAIRGLPALRDARRMVMVNDSIYGPFDTFPAFLARVRGSAADVVGTVASNEQRPHYQSFLIVFGERALRSKAFWRFWKHIRNGGRDFVIDRYETKLARRMAEGGLTTEALYPAPTDGSNLTLTDAWRDLIAAGFPFVKVRLLRNNPCDADLSGWRDLLRGHGYDVGLIDAHLGDEAQR